MIPPGVKGRGQGGRRDGWHVGLRGALLGVLWRGNPSDVTQERVLVGGAGEGDRALPPGWASGTKRDFYVSCDSAF